jgi:hypothetical protein
MSTLANFDRFIAVDWSGADGRYTGIAIAECAAGRGAPRLVRAPGVRWTRTAVVEWLSRELGRGERLLVGFDFAFAVPFEPGLGYLAGAVPAAGDLFALWDVIDAASGSDVDFGCGGFVADPRFAALYWRSGKQPKTWIARRRLSELACATATRTHPECVFKLIGSKQVGKASLTGVRVLREARRRHPVQVAVWPFEPVGRKSAFVEIYPTLFRKQTAGGLAKLRDAAALNAALGKLGSRGVRDAMLTDHDTDALISAAGLRTFVAEGGALPEPADERIRREGWIFGVPMPAPPSPPTLTLPRKGGGNGRRGSFAASAVGSVLS